MERYTHESADEIWPFYIKLAQFNPDESHFLECASELRVLPRAILQRNHAHLSMIHAVLVFQLLSLEFLYRKQHFSD